MDFNSLTQQWFGVEEIGLLFDPEAVVYLVLALALFAVGKKINDWLSPYNLSEELTTHDNKAIAVSFGGYLFGLGIIIWSVLSSPSAEDATLPSDIGSTILWTLIGTGLLLAARLINNRFLLHQFDNFKELVTDRNVGTGVVQAGAYIGSALMVRAALYGEDSGGFLASFISAIVYFLVGQLAFILFGMAYQKISAYDLHAEIEKDNVAAGLGFGMTLVAVGVLLSGYLLKFDSLVGLAVWFVIGVLFLLACRFLVDKLVLPGSLLDDEISKDQNWGSALIEGAAAISLAFILVALFG